MTHSHGLAAIGSPGRSITILCVLMLAFFGSEQLQAQNPAYSFANAIGSTGADYGNDIAVDGTGNLYVTGRFQGTVDFDPSGATANLTSSTAVPGDRDIFVASYDATGAYRWAFRVGGGGENEGLSIAVDGGGNVVVTGRFMNTADFDPGTGTATLASAGWSTFVARYGPTGDHLWSFKLGPYSPWNDVAIDANGNVVVVGTFQGTVDFNPGSGTATLTSVRADSRNSSNNNPDIFVAKYSSSGAYQWAFRIGNGYWEYAAAVDVDASGNIYLTGFINNTLGATSSSAVDFDPGKGKAELTGIALYVAKYSGAGAYLWAFKLAGAQMQADNDLAVDGNGNVTVTGGFRGTIDFNPGTGTANLTSVGTGSLYDIFVARYSSAGSYQWAFTPSVGYTRSVTADGNGDIYITGSIRGVNDFDPGTGSATLPVNSVGWGSYFAKYTASGSYQWAFPLTAEQGIATGLGGVVDGNGNLYVTGYFNETIDFDPGDATASLTSAGGADIFIAQYTQTPLQKRAMHDNDASITMTATPNPFTGDFTLRYDGPSVPARIDVVDIMGRIVESHEVDGSTEITLGAELPAGAYIVQITQGQARRQVVVRKVE